MEDLHPEAYSDPLPDNFIVFLRLIPDIMAVAATGLFMFASPEILRWYYENYQNYQLYISHFKSREIYVLAALVSQLPTVSILTYTLISRLSKPINS